ncbi:MAG: hypothetical protein RLZZ58_1979 [Pseudomonadota bacterium]
MIRLRFFLTLLVAVLFTPWSAPARADVTVQFYSHEFGKNFPHAFITMKGTLNATGQAVDAAYGFTAISISPGILLGSVKGAVQTPKADYIAKSEVRFTMVVDDAGYAKVMARVAAWRDAKQPSYSLNARNCVHFVAEVAQALGLKTNAKSKFFKKPRSFLEEVRGLNPGVK